MMTHDNLGVVNLPDTPTRLQINQTSTIELNVSLSSLHLFSKLLKTELQAQIRME